ncbi:glucans biosynthesis glucosyltransferase MdoH [Phenylobacterium sp.]|uniref:glucans biosynthesis glucosyltransferase MdoH n=1 Tax=Phenylobacterium sp. TaxID=1871053 RepID=UPI0030019B23
MKAAPQVRAGLERRVVPYPALRSLPAPAPLAMPEQRLDQGPSRLPPILDVGLRRILLIGLTLALTAAAGWRMTHILTPGGLGLADLGMLVLFCILFAWIAFAFLSGVAGLFLTWRGARARWRPRPVILTRTALLAPVYNEDPHRVLAGLEAIHEDLVACGVAELYDIFVLSDTRDPDIARDEATGVLRLRARTGAPDRFFYRRRALNRDRKAGNIAEWVTACGADYEGMVILDADSLMSGDTLVRLTAELERDPKAGLIQTLPTIINGSTLFARMQQFAGRLYGPMVARGQAWWSGAEGNYWGHNAIIRTRTFAACAGLPHIKGGKPFGGHILSHDFVEAALLRRGGWAVRMAAHLDGSYEETPPSLVDMAVRDRRWCQGNLQHAAVLPARGLHWVSRLHMARGILAYATSPLWLGFLILGGLVWANQRQAPGAESSAALTLFAVTMAMLMAPKAMAAVMTLSQTGARRAYGGAARLLAGVVAELVLSSLIAASMMLMQSRAVVDVLLGRDSGWNAQTRDDPQISLADAWRRHRRHTATGLAWVVLAGLLDPMLLAWTSPLALGLVLSAPLTVWTSRAHAPGRWGIFQTPEEAVPPRVISRANALRLRHEGEHAARREIDRLMSEPVPPHIPAAVRVRPRRQEADVTS